MRTIKRYSYNLKYANYYVTFQSLFNLRDQLQLKKSLINLLFMLFNQGKT